MKKNIPFISLCIALVLYISFCYLVSGDSMEPSFHSGQTVLINRFRDEYSCGDIVIFKSEKNKFGIRQKYIKRIIGTPGDTIRIFDGKIYVNESVSSYINEEVNDPGELEYPLILMEDEYFVVGDNINNSKDSRILGPIKKKDIIGRVLSHQ